MRETDADDSMEWPEPPWDQLFERAGQVVRKTVAGFPPELKSIAEKLPCLLEKWPDEELEEHTLGIYTGFDQGHVSESNGPIVLFLGSLYYHCLEEDLDFEEEVRITFLHEFGHHLGWDESDLEDRGLF